MLDKHPLSTPAPGATRAYGWWCKFDVSGLHGRFEFQLPTSMQFAALLDE